MKIVLIGALMLATPVALAAGTAESTTTLRFSDQPPGATMPPGWTHYQVSRKKAVAPVRLIVDDGTTTLHIHTDHSAGAIMHPLNLSPHMQLGWRWKIDHVVAKADLARKRGDDFAARVYVFFDVPKSDLTFGERLKRSLARHVMGKDIPKAALCYVWDNSHPVGTIAPNAYYGAVRTVVLESGNAKAGRWQIERRDLAADFRAAFGRAAPKVTGIALAADTDNTGGQSSTWFGDVTLAPVPAAVAKPASNTKEGR